jgi:hypothetical protein
MGHEQSAEKFLPPALVVAAVESCKRYPSLGRTFSCQPPNRGFLSGITDFAAVTLNRQESKFVSPLAAGIISLQREGTSIVWSGA